MKVKDLIDILNKCPKDSNVKIEIDTYGGSLSAYGIFDVTKVSNDEDGEDIIIAHFG